MTKKDYELIAKELGISFVKANVTWVQATTIIAQISSGLATDNLDFRSDIFQDAVWASVNKLRPGLER